MYEKQPIVLDNHSTCTPVAVVAFKASGMIGMVSSYDPGEPAREAAKYYRRYYPSVKIMTYDELSEAMEREIEERRSCYYD